MDRRVVGPLVLTLVLLTACSGGETPAKGPAGEGEPAAEPIVFPAPLDSFGEKLGLTSVPELIEDSAPGCKDAQLKGKAGFCAPNVDIQRMYAFVAQLQKAPAQELFGAKTFPCGFSPDGYFTVCGSEDLPKPGPMLIVAIELEEALPTPPPGTAEGEFWWASSETRLAGVLFDGDGQTPNNSIVPDDARLGSDAAIIATVPTEITDDWAVNALQVGGSDTRARVVINGSWVIFFIPGEHFTADAPAVRVFTHATIRETSNIDFSVTDKEGYDVLPGPPDAPWELAPSEVIETTVLAG